MWLGALVLALFAAGCLLTAIANPRDPIDDLLAEPAPFGCSRCCGEWTDLAAYYAHECHPWTERDQFFNRMRAAGSDK